MGFYITDDNEVRTDHSIKDFGDTTSVHNPTYDITQCPRFPMRVTSVFKRDKLEGRRQIGDNCPFLYGLKQKQNLTVGLRGVKPLLAPFWEILWKFAHHCHERQVTFDGVVPMPSSHAIARLLAKRVALVLSAPVIEGVFQKASCQDITAQLSTAAMPHQAKINIGSALRRAKHENRPFSLSDVKTKFRHHICPLTTAAPGVKCHNVLLVDDLFATGQTLVAAKNAMLDDHMAQYVESLCLFSPLNGRIRRLGKRPASTYR